MDAVGVSFSAVLLLGLSFGSGPCNIACLPYLGPVLFTRGGGVRHAWHTLLPFSLGRVTGYSLLGTLAGASGAVLMDWLQAPWMRGLLGAATLLVALALLRKRRQGSCSTRPQAETQTIQPPRKLLPSSLFLMGAGMALTPCAPLGMVLLAAAASASASIGFSLGFAFGLGAVIIPAFIFGFAVAHLSQELKNHLSQWRGKLEDFGIGLLVLMGISTALGWISA